MDEDNIIFIIVILSWFAVTLIILSVLFFVKQSQQEREDRTLPMTISKWLLLALAVCIMISLTIWYMYL
jgi:uncharacterized membrane protein YidH (DUF202 family)